MEINNRIRLSFKARNDERNSFKGACKPQLIDIQVAVVPLLCRPDLQYNEIYTLFQTSVYIHVGKYPKFIGVNVWRWRMKRVTL